MPIRQDRTLEQIVALCKFKDWDIVYREKDDVPYLQVQFNAKDCITGVVERQHCRKWMLSHHMCESEVVRTAFKAVSTAMQHEVEEYFKLGGEPIYRPHFDVWSLFNLSQNNRIDKRR